MGVQAAVDAIAGLAEYRDAFQAIGEAAQRGWVLFNGRARCDKCHALSEQTRAPTNFTDNPFHNFGIGIIRHDVAAFGPRPVQPEPPALGRPGP